MVLDEDVAAVLATLPPTSFVASYINYAYNRTTAPAAYHLGCALALLAVTAPPDYGLEYISKLRPNMYIMLAGRSGEDQKSTALGIAREILFEAAAPLIGENPASKEGLIEALQHKPRQLIPFGEFGSFLATAQKGYAEPIKTTLTDAWDATPLSHARTSK